MNEKITIEYVLYGPGGTKVKNEHRIKALLCSNKAIFAELLEGAESGQIAFKIDDIEYAGSWKARMLPA